MYGREVRRIDSENHSVLKLFDMNDGSNPSKGRCSRGPDCKAPRADLGKYSCVHCKVGLHTAVFGCSEIFRDNLVQCAEGFGCRNHLHLPGKRTKQSQSTLRGFVVTQQKTNTNSTAPTCRRSDRSSSPERKGRSAPEVAPRTPRNEGHHADGSTSPVRRSPRINAKASLTVRKSPRKHAPPSSIARLRVSQSPNKRQRAVNPGGQKRGPRQSSTREETKSLQDWYIVCNLYRRENPKEETATISKAAFLRSDMSGNRFSGTVSEQNTFGKRLKQYDAGELKPSQNVRFREGMYPLIEDRLINYLDLRQKKYLRDKCGVSWMYLEHKAKEFKKQVETDHPLYKSFQASPGWLSNVLKRHNKLGVTLHGEASDISPEVRKATMAKWLVLFHAAIEDNDIHPACLYNPDEFGLFYQKLPNRMYVDSGQKNCCWMQANERQVAHYCHALHCCRWIESSAGNRWKSQEALLFHAW